jgi:hypothetical protein
MPEKQVINGLKKAGFFYYVDSLEGNIPFEGAKANDLFERFYELVEHRGIPNTTLKREKIEKNNYLIISHKINPEINVHLAVNTELYGKDLRINLLFAQCDLKKVGNQTMWGTVLTGMGVIFCWTGVGLVALAIGIGMLVGAKNKFRTEFETERDAFYSTILGIFSNACDESGIDFDAESKKRVA